MKTSNEQQKLNAFSLPSDEQSKPLTVFSDIDRDENRRDEDDEKQPEVQERRDWGDVDPAGGDAPTSPGSAV